MNFKSQVPSAYGQVDSISGPTQSYDSKGNCRVKHREFVCDLFGASNPFTVLREFVANPTIVESFPWLSGMSGNFQKFCFEKLCLHYVTQSPTTTAGSIMIIPQYDVDSPIPKDKNEALTFQDSVRSPAWQECCAVLPKNRLCAYKEYFTKMDLSDLKLSIPAKLQIASSGTGDSSPLSGELWVEYDIRLSCPQRTPQSTDFLMAPEGSTSGFFLASESQDYYRNISNGIYTNVSSTVGRAVYPPGRYYGTILWANLEDVSPGSYNVTVTAEEGSGILNFQSSTSSETTQLFGFSEFTFDVLVTTSSDVLGIRFTVENGTGSAFYTDCYYHISVNSVIELPLLED